MFFQIDPGDAAPIYEQISRQIQFAVASGGLAPGEMVPSVRELARRLAVNPNTVARAYRELQSLGILDAQRGLGLTVAADAVDKCRDQRGRWIRERLAQVVAEALRAKVSARQLQIMLQDVIQTLSRQESPT
ncbi:GntR family transcriptional regulator [Thermopirellula anaerolimosa]